MELPCIHTCSQSGKTLNSTLRAMGVTLECRCSWRATGEMDLAVVDVSMPDAEAKAAEHNGVWVWASFQLPVGRPSLPALPPPCSLRTCTHYKSRKPEGTEHRSLTRNRRKHQRLRHRMALYYASHSALTRDQLKSEARKCIATKQQQHYINPVEIRSQQHLTLASGAASILSSDPPVQRQAQR